MKGRELEIKIMRDVSRDALENIGATYLGPAKLLDQYVLATATGEILKLRRTNGIYELIYKHDDVSMDKRVKDRIEEPLRFFGGDNPIDIFYKRLGVRKIFDVPKIRHQYLLGGFEVHTENVFELGPIFEVEVRDKDRVTNETVLEYNHKLFDVAASLGFNKDDMENRSIFKMLRQHYKISINKKEIYQNGIPLKNGATVQKIPAKIYEMVA